MDAGEGKRGAAVGHSFTREAAQSAAERLVFFSDAVVAIALTLLAIELPVPTGGSAQELAQSLADGSAEYLAFGISFLVIFLHWGGHHRVFRYLTDAPPTLVRWNGLWLMSIVLTPFVTRVLTGGDGEGTGFPYRFGLYALVQVLASVSFLSCVRTMAREHLIEEGGPADLASNSRMRILAIAVPFAVSIPFAFVIHEWAYLIWSLGPSVVSAGVRVWRSRRPGA